MELVQGQGQKKVPGLEQVQMLAQVLEPILEMELVLVLEQKKVPGLEQVQEQEQVLEKELVQAQE